MRVRAGCIAFGLFSFCIPLLTPILALAQGAGGEQNGQPGGPSIANPIARSNSSLEVSVDDDEGGAITRVALVTLTMGGGTARQATTEAGLVEFNNLPPGSYTLHVIADGYESAKQTIAVTGEPAIVKVRLRRRAGDTLKGVSAFFNSGGSASLMSTNAKAQRQVAKITVALRTNKPELAHADLERLYLEMPTDPNLNYLYGLYEKEIKDLARAKFYWRKAVAIDPSQIAALLELAHAELSEEKPAEAISFLNRAVQVSPAAWHPHAMMVLAYLKLKQYDSAIREADRAVELNHSQAAFVLPALAGVLASDGHTEEAIQVLQHYLQERPQDSKAQNLLAALQPSARVSSPEAAAAPSLASSLDVPPLLPSAWMPPAVDEVVPPVEPGIPCPLDTVLPNTSKRITELAESVDRFEATESLEHERISSFGVPSKAELRTYRYQVTIAEVRPGMLSVDEFHGFGVAQEDFPDGVQTVGLPALALVFHPMQIHNYEFTCEGLAQLSSGLSWQVYFQQKADRIPTLHGYRSGERSIPIALKGRAWIAADTYQVLRLETDMVKPHPEIRLAAEHTFIEYGPVKFRTRDVRLWLPRTADIYLDWRGKRAHRRLTYSDYLLFSVDDRQQIQAPKAQAPPGNN